MRILNLFSNIRFYILIFSISLSIGINLWVQNYIPEGAIQNIRLTQIYAFCAIIYLYLALLAGPFCYQMQWFPWRGQYLKARRAIGVSAFYFGFLHAYTAFLGQLGGFAGLPYLNSNYLIAITLSFTALLILTAMAATSIDKVIDWMTFPRWKFLHRFVYIAGIFIIIHALMLGTHFQDLSQTIPRIAFVLLSFLFYLEARRIDYFIQTKWLTAPKFGIATILLFFFVGIGTAIYIVPPKGGVVSLGIHSQHIQIAKDAQNTNATPSTTNQTLNIPGLQGDRSKRFTVDFDHQENIQPNQDTNLSFRVFDASSGSKILLFQKVYEQNIHLIVVDKSLTYFNHIHPTQNGDTFTITTQFPKNGEYHLYTDFQPFGAIEQQFGFTLQVGNGEAESASVTPDTELTKQFGDYKVTLEYPKPLLSSKVSVGEQILKFAINDSNRDPVTNLKPYLGTFGHLVMINAETYDYVHVHPNRLTPINEGETGGPDVEFMPLGIYGQIKPGVYRIFAQFNPDGKLFTADFTIEVE